LCWALVLAGLAPQARAQAQTPPRPAFSPAAEEEPLPREVALFEAVRGGDIARMRALIRSGVNFDARTSEGDTILTLALRHDQEDVVRAALDFKPELNRVGALGMSALSLATVHGLQATAQRLLRAGADVNQADADGVTPLAAALRLHQFTLAQRYLDGGADPLRADRNGTTPLHILASGGDAAGGLAAPLLTPRLLERGADPNALDAESASPLFLALLHHHPDVAEAIVRQGSTDLRRPTQGYTPLHWARQFGYADLARLIAARLPEGG
jgi:ankyrin repeat protein